MWVGEADCINLRLGNLSLEWGLAGHSQERISPFRDAVEAVI